MTSPFDDPEIRDLFGELCGTLLEESDRGAVLVGATFVDNSMRRLFDDIFAAELSVKKRKELLDYPGPLSSFSAKTEIAYALRIIPKSIYESLSALRKLRNDLAHAPDKFSLRDNLGQLHRIHDFGVDLPNDIRWLAFRVMFEQKVKAIREMVDQMIGADPEMSGVGPRTDEEAVDYIISKPELVEILEIQLPKWELVLGISLLCSSIALHRDRSKSVIHSAKLLGGISHSDRMDNS